MRRIKIDFKKLMFADTQRYRQYIMVATDTEKTGVSTYFVGVPDKAPPRCV
jgi:hypothetical protein